MKHTLWLTYAWKDNEDESVDFVIQQLQSAGLEVRYDRRQLIPGQRLWPQIEACITSPDLDAWAIYVTENSLRSEPCREELQYALDEAINARGAGFPLIGIVPGSVDRKLLPKAITTRIFVNLRDDDWINRVVAGVKKEHPAEPELDVDEFGCDFRELNGKYTLEVWPRLGSWGAPIVVLMLRERDALNFVSSGVRKQNFGTGAYVSGHEGVRGETYFKRIPDTVSAERTLHVLFNYIPSFIEFGGTINGVSKMYRIDFSPKQA